VIRDEVRMLEPPERLEQEIREHEHFGAQRVRHFVGREDILARISTYLNAYDPYPLAVWGAPGAGKSALIAEAAQEAWEANPGAEVVLRFIGATPESADGRSLIASLCREIARRYGEDVETPADYRELVDEFPKRLGLASVERPLIIFLDELDRLSDADGARSLVWLPAELPEHVRIVVSTSGGDVQFSLEARLPETNLIELGPMSRQQGEELLDLWLFDAGRSVTPVQRDEVLDKFEPEGLPLYLRLAFEEARRWRSDTPEEEVRLGSGIPGIIRENLLRRLARDHGELLASRALGYLAAAKDGLAEDELLGVLSAEADLLEDVHRRSHGLQEFDRLPAVVWSRLHFDLEPYLTGRAADGAQLLHYAFRQLREVVETDYLDGERGLECHRRLAHYFSDEIQPLEPETDGEVVPNLRKLAELPYQQARGELWDELFKTLTDFRFLEMKAAHSGVVETEDAEGNVKRTYTGGYLLQDDFARALEGMPPGEPRGRVGAMNRALRHEAHVLSQRPHLLWQQLFNRLQWGILAPEVQRRSGEGAWPWFRLRNPLLLRDDPLIRTLEGHRGMVNDCALSPDGSFVVTAGGDYTLKIWDTSTGISDTSKWRERASLEGHTDWVNGCAVSPDGSSVVSASSDGTVRIWEAVAGAEQRVLKGHDGPVNSCSLSGDGSVLVTAGNDGTVRLWDPDRGEPLPPLQGRHREAATSCAISRDGRLVVSAGVDGALKFWDARSGRELRTLEGHAGRVFGCAVSPEGDFVVSAGDDALLRVWDSETGAERMVLAGHAAGVNACAVSPDGSLVTSASSDETVRIWDAATGAARMVLAGHAAGVNACAVNRDGSVIFSAGDDGTLRAWSTGPGPAGRAIGGHTDSVSGCAVSPDGSFIVTAGSDRTLRIWDRDGQERVRIEGHTDSVSGCAVSPDGSFIVSSSRDGELRLWHPVTGAGLSVIGGPRGAHGGAPLLGCAVSPDGSYVVSASEDGTLKLWDSRSGAELRTLEGHRGSVWACALSPDGSCIVSASSDKTLKLWDPPSGAVLRTLEGHSDRVLGCGVSPDGSLIVSAGEDRTARLWDAPSGLERTTLVGHDDVVWGCEVTPDGSYVVSVSRDRTLRIWDALTGGEMAVVPLVEGADCVALHPGLPLAVAGDAIGGLYLFDLIGVQYGSIVVTAVDLGEGLVIRCPHCNVLHTFDRECEACQGSHNLDEWLGNEKNCPNDACGGPLKINDFVVPASPPSSRT